MTFDQYQFLVDALTLDFSQIVSALLGGLSGLAFVLAVTFKEG